MSEIGLWKLFILRRFQVREKKYVTRRSWCHEASESLVVSVTVILLGCCFCFSSTSLLIIESSRPARCFPRISETYKSPLQQVEGARRKVLLPVFYEWLPEGSRDNSSQPCPSRSLTSSTSLSTYPMGCHIISFTGRRSKYKQKMRWNSWKAHQLQIPSVRTWNRKAVNFWPCSSISV